MGIVREENAESENVSLALIQGQSVQNRDKMFKAPLKIGKVWDPSFQEFKGTRCCYNDGFSLHANVKILSHLRSVLEQLCRYVLRSPLSKDRISYDSNNGKVNLKLKKPYLDGTTYLQFSPEQFIKRVIALIPPPRQNLIRYIGVFGAGHKKRSAITGLAKPKKKGQKENTSNSLGRATKTCFQI